MHIDHARKRKDLFNRFLLRFSVLLMLLGGLQPGLMPVQAAEAITTNDAGSGTSVSANSTGSVSAAAVNGKWLTYKLDGFSGSTVDQLFAVQGAAEVPSGANFLRLTPAVTLQSGAAFNKLNICPKNNYSFSTAFSFQMSNPSTEGASDGLTFTLQGGTSSPLTNGGSLGFFDIKPSFTVKYDTFLNANYNDPSANYIGLAQNGSPINNTPDWYIDLDQYNTANGTNFVLSNGTQYYTWIDYNGLTQNVQVRLGTSPDRANSNLILDVANIDLGTIFAGEDYHAGFTGTTGFPNYENHDIHSWYFLNDYAPIETLDPQNDYRQAPSSLDLTTEPADNQGEHKVTITLLDPLGNPVQGASLDALTTTVGELTGPNGEPVTDLVSDADGKVHAILKNADRSKGITITASIGCASDSDTIPASNEPPVNGCPPPVALINGSFEEPPHSSSDSRLSTGPGYFAINQAFVPGWETTDSSGVLEIFNQSLMDQISPGSAHDQNGLKNEVIHGQQFAELNSREPAQLYQDVETTPGQTIYWRLAHKGRLGDDTMSVKIGSANVAPRNLPVIDTITTGKDQWQYYSGTYIVPVDQTITRFGFEAVLQLVVIQQQVTSWTTFSSERNHVLSQRNSFLQLGKCLSEMN